MELHTDSGTIVLESASGPPPFEAVLTWGVLATLAGLVSISFALTVAGIAVVLLAPSSRTLIFDPASRRVLVHLALCWGIYERRDVYGFSDVHGLSLRTFETEHGALHGLLLCLRNQERIAIVPLTRDGTAVADAMDSIASATGLPRTREAAVVA